MGNLREQLLRAGLASGEQVRKAESERRVEEARRRFEEENTWRNFREAYPVFKKIGGLPPDTPVHIYPQLEFMMLWARLPQRGRRLETGYGSPYIGTTLVAKVDPHTHELELIPINPDHTGKNASDVSTSRMRALYLLVVEQHERELTVYVRLD